MKKLSIIICVLCLAFIVNNAKGESASLISGTIQYSNSPCFTEPCLPGVVLSVKVDTASYILSLNNHWFNDGSIMINNIEYLVDDLISVYGNITAKKDNKNRDYYVLEIIERMTELKDVQEEEKVTNINNSNYGVSNFSVISNSHTGFVQIKSINDNPYANINIFSSTGQIIKKGMLNNNDQLSLDKGFYILTITDNNQILHKEKILIIK